MSSYHFDRFIFSFLENITQSSQGIDSQTEDSSSPASANSTNPTSDNSRLQAARYHKKESDWDELLAQVGSSPMRRRIRQMFFFTIMIVRVPPSLHPYLFFLLVLTPKRTRGEVEFTVDEQSLRTKSKSMKN